MTPTEPTDFVALAAEDEVAAYSKGIALGFVAARKNGELNFDIGQARSRRVQ